MVISFDGNVYTGKTTLIRKIQSFYSDVIVVPEYNNDNQYLADHSHFEGQKFFLDQEQKRISYINESCLVLLDRSFLSVLAHTYAYDKMNKSNELSVVAQYTKGLIDRDRILLPNKLFFLTDNLGVLADTENKGTTRIFFDSEYRTHINEFLSLAGKHLNNTLHIQASDDIIVKNTVKCGELNQMLTKFSYIEFIDKIVKENSR